MATESMRMTDRIPAIKRAVAYPAQRQHTQGCETPGCDTILRFRYHERQSCSYTAMCAQCQQIYRFVTKAHGRSVDIKVEKVAQV